MTTTHTRTNVLTATVGAAIATVAAPALFLLGGDTAQATTHISARGPAGTIADLPTPRECPGCGGFNPQPDPSGDPDPDTKVGVGTPGVASPSLNPGDAIGFIVIGG